MRLDSLFRLSTYLTLAMATVCLATAEEPFLAGMTFSTVPIGILLMVAYKVDGRWALSVLASNLLGLLIACASAVWIGYRVLVAPPGWTDSVPYPAALLPFGGPVLMLLLAAKLLRPKVIADFWSLHVIGLLQVALGCVLALDPTFALFLLGYLACASWSLMLFRHYREQTEAARRNQMKMPPADAALANILSAPAAVGRIWGLGPGMRRALVIAVLGMVLFLLTPRWSSTQWQLPVAAGKAVSGAGEVGFSRRIDLNHTGQLKISDKVAFEAVVNDAQGRPKLDLTPEQRWRGVTLDYYDEGRWISRHLDLPADLERLSNLRVREGDPSKLPHLSADEYFVTITLKPREVEGLFLCEPVILPDPPTRPPAVSIGPSPWRPLFHPRDGTLGRPQQGQTPEQFRYTQVTRPLRGSELIPALRLRREYEERLLQQPVKRIKSCTAALLQRLVVQGKLAGEDLAGRVDPEDKTRAALPPHKRSMVAQALADYLGTSGDYTYTLDLRRNDLSVDPTEDFLCNVKQGHCEYYATALVLMLRSAGIPARIVNGFRGAEGQFQDGQPNGTYLIRERHAHAWVEALVGDEAGMHFWLTLDPTSTVQAALGGGSWAWSRGWDRATSLGRSLWKGLFIEAERNPVHDGIAGWVAAELPAFRLKSWPTYALAVVSGAAVVWLVFSLFRWSPWLRGRWIVPSRPAAGVAFYGRWLTLVSRQCGLMPGPSQTPLEFAEVIGQAFLKRETTRRWSDVPRVVVRLYYRARYGGRPLTALERHAIDEQMDGVEWSLRNE